MEIAMEFKQKTIQEILESETLMVLTAPERYGAYYDNALACSMFLTHFVKSIDIDRWVFGSFLSQVKKHHTLSLFSTVRLHKVQAMMNLRQALEAGANAAFAIANPDHAHFVDTDDHGILDPAKSLTGKRYKWLDENYPAGSQAIKALKDQINQVTAHSNLVTTHNNFETDSEEAMFSAPFFDIEDKYHVETDLWMIARAAIILLDIFWGVNKNYNSIKFVDDFPTAFLQLQTDNQSLHAISTQSDRYKRAMEIENHRSQKQQASK